MIRAIDGTGTGDRPVRSDRAGSGTEFRPVFTGLMKMRKISENTQYAVVY
jgi:hypothetical protein